MHLLNVEKVETTPQKTHVEIELDDSQKRGLFSGSTTIFARVRFVFTMKSIRYSTKSMNLKCKHHDLHPKTFIDCHFTIKHRQQINRTKPFHTVKTCNSKLPTINFGLWKCPRRAFPFARISYQTRSSSIPLEMVNWAHVVFKDTSIMLVSWIMLIHVDSSSHQIVEHVNWLKFKLQNFETYHGRDHIGKGRSSSGLSSSSRGPLFVFKKRHPGYPHGGLFSRDLACKTT